MCVHFAITKLMKSNNWQCFEFALNFIKKNYQYGNIGHVSKLYSVYSEYKVAVEERDLKLKLPKIFADQK